MIYLRSSFKSEPATASEREKWLLGTWMSLQSWGGVEKWREKNMHGYPCHSVYTYSRLQPAREESPYRLGCWFGPFKHKGPKYSYGVFNSSSFNLSPPLAWELRQKVATVITGEFTLESTEIRMSTHVKQVIWFVHMVPWFVCVCVCVWTNTQLSG